MKNDLCAIRSYNGQYFKDWELLNSMLTQQLENACTLANHLYKTGQTIGGHEAAERAQNLRRVLVDRGVLPQSSL